MTFSPTPTLPKTIEDRYLAVRAQTETLCKSLSPEDQVVQPISDVSPPKWHLGHTTWFFENLVLAAFLPEYRLVDENLNFIFNSYYESQGPRIHRSKRGNLTRPSLQRVLDYRKAVDESMMAWMVSGQVPQKALDIIELGLHHEQQHQELLLTDIKYILGTNPFFPPYHKGGQMPSGQTRSARFIPIEEGLYDIGYRGNDFCYDNELGVHKVYLQPFAIMDRLVTNGEYMAFIEAGGYDQFSYWLDEGWQWVQGLEEKAPLYWYKRGAGWHHYTLHGLKPIDPDLPVTHISYFEADAYARWRGLRLPTEQEWEVACSRLSPGLPQDAAFFAEGGIHHPGPCVTECDNQLLGHAWEWCSSSYLPYPGFPRLEGALGEYNGKFMVNQMVLRGGSVATPLSHIRMTYRNFFHTDKRWQFTGIRLVREL